MARRTIRATPSDAPPATAKDPNPAAAGLSPDSDDQSELIGRTVTINRPRHELYEFWRDFRNLPFFMENIESVAILDERRSHWVVKGPVNSNVEWDSLIVDDVPGELISWRSAEGAYVSNSGRIEFRDASNGRGTVVTVTITYDPPAGKIGKLFAKLFQREPNMQARQDLRRFKQLMETGEISSAQTPMVVERSES